MLTQQEIPNFANERQFRESIMKLLRMITMLNQMDEIEGITTSMRHMLEATKK
jgi:hypothetical protein